MSLELKQKKAQKPEHENTSGIFESNIKNYFDKALKPNQISINSKIFVHLSDSRMSLKSLLESEGLTSHILTILKKIDRSDSEENKKLILEYLENLKKTLPDKLVNTIPERKGFMPSEDLKKAQETVNDFLTRKYKKSSYYEDLFNYEKNNEWSEKEEDDMDGEDYELM